MLTTWLLTTGIDHVLRILHNCWAGQQPAKSQAIGKKYIKRLLKELIDSSERSQKKIGCQRLKYHQTSY